MTGAPAGFREVHAEEPTGVRVDKDALSGGVVVRFVATRRFTRADGSTTVVHIFQNRGGKGKRFSVFGTAQLDSKLRNIKSGSILWVLYAGKRPVDGAETHVWHVSNAGVLLDDVKIADLARNSEKAADHLDAAIARAESERAASGSGREPDIGQYDEDNGRDFAPDNR